MNYILNEKKTQIRKRKKRLKKLKGGVVAMMHYYGTLLEQ